MRTTPAFWFRAAFFWHDYPHTHLSGAMKQYYVVRILGAAVDGPPLRPPVWMVGPSTNYGGRWPLPLWRRPPSPPPSPPSSSPVATAVVVTAIVVTAAAVPSAAAIKQPPPSHHPSTTRPARHTATPAHHPDAPARRPDPRPRPY
ncbi:hypothetical protein C8F04DRAFT_1394589 [Mycena alexandri]|uniref:Uncharacterized protein n=1 Tax=Mycena alexandri TaxID=1745969 RepID=A0AAD6SZP5_9AGAR|nr:hypothetical protein C8F04DRAFT_1394589 [Mycena alexandri]